MAARLSCRAPCHRGPTRSSPEWFDGGVQGGVEITAYLVNESRARRPDLAGDRLAAHWIPADERDNVTNLWDEFADTVYPHDDLVVSLRGRFVADTLRAALERDRDTVLVVCGAGFSSYPWLLDFAASLEVDLPANVAAKRRRVAQLVADGVIDDRAVEFLAVDLADPAGRARLVDQARKLADGRPLALVSEGMIFYLPPDAAHGMLGVGAQIAAGPRVEVLSYWPVAAADNAVLEAQRTWFADNRVPDDSTYLEAAEVAALLGGEVQDRGPEDLQRHYLGEVVVPEAELIPEYVVSARA